MEIIRAAAHWRVSRIGEENNGNARDWIDILQALLTPTIAFLGLLIAWLQWRINNNRLKMERFDGRFTRFEATRRFLQKLIQQGGFEEPDRLQFLSETTGSRFVFDVKISTYLDELHSKAVDLETLNTELSDCPKSERGQKVRERADLKKWMIAQLRGLEQKFTPYF